MLVGGALDVAFALKSVEAVHDGLVGRNLASGLDFPDEGGLAMLSDEALNAFQDSLLFAGDVLQKDALVRLKYCYQGAWKH